MSQESSKSCSLLGPEHTPLMDTLLDTQQHFFLLFLLGQANFVPLLVNSVVNSILAFSQLYLDVKKRYEQQAFHMLQYLYAVQQLVMDRCLLNVNNKNSVH